MSHWIKLLGTQSVSENWKIGVGMTQLGIKWWTRADIFCSHKIYKYFYEFVGLCSTLLYVIQLPLQIYSPWSLQADSYGPRQWAPYSVSGWIWSVESPGRTLKGAGWVRSGYLSSLLRPCGDTLARSLDGTPLLFSRQSSLYGFLFQGSDNPSSLSPCT